MKVKCRYCDSFISDTCERCPNCGAVNEELKRVGDGVPTTISELKKWYVDHNLPDEVVTRFFIGKDYKEARAFGIYYDESKDLYIVYKNKDNGERKIRYEGKDEKYAVNELYMKLKEEILNQKSLNRNHFKNSNNFSIFDNKLFVIHFISMFVVMFTTMFFNPIPGLFMFLSLNPGIFIMMLVSNFIKDKKKVLIIDKFWHIISFVVCFILIIICVIRPIIVHADDAYYKYNGVTYYNYGNNWYYYDYNSWKDYSGDTENFEYLGGNYDDKYEVSDFKESDYYEDHKWSSSSSSDDWDSDSSWDSSDSWDSEGIDWGSDW